MPQYPQRRLGRHQYSKVNRLWQQGAFTLGVAEECFGLREATRDATRLRDLHLFRVPFIGLLRCVRVTGGAAARFHGEMSTYSVGENILVSSATS